MHYFVTKYSTDSVSVMEENKNDKIKSPPPRRIGNANLIWFEEYTALVGTLLVSYYAIFSNVYPEKCFLTAVAGERRHTPDLNTKLSNTHEQRT